MPKKKKTDLNLERSIKIGQKSKELIPRVKMWCKNIRIRESYGGMIGQMGLPTMVGISCPHTGAGYEGMHFESSARDFIIENCRSCEFHDEPFHKNFGREVLDDYETFLQKEEKEKAEREKAEKHLDEKIASLIKKGEDTAEISEVSILKQIKRLRKEEELCGAMPILNESSKIAPEFFKKIAVNALELYLADHAKRNGCLTILCNLASYPGKISQKTFERAWDTFSPEAFETQEINQLAFLARPFITKERLEFLKEFLTWMIEGQNHWHIPGTLYEKPNFDDCNDVLLHLAKLDPDFFRGLFQSYLKEDNPDRRKIGANVLFNLIGLEPEIGHLLYEDIIMAFERDDEMFAKADRLVQGILARLLIAFPDITLKKIREFELLLSVEAKEALWGTYEAYGDLLRDEESVPAGFERVMEQLIHSFSKREITLQGTRILAEAIRKNCRQFPIECAVFIDPILGGLTLWMDQISEFLNSLETEKGKPAEGLRPLEILGKRTDLAVITGKLEDSVQYIVKENRNLVFERIVPTISQLSSKAHWRLKSKLISLVRKSLVKSSEIAKIIPFLYKYIMDQDSVDVRVEAIRFLGDLLKKSPELVPDNLVELVIIFASDHYEGVVKEVAKIYQRITPRSTNQRLELLRHFMPLEKHYFKHKPKFSYELAKAILNLSKEFGDTYLKIVPEMLGRYVTVNDSEIRKDAMSRLFRLTTSTRNQELLDLWSQRTLEQINSKWDEMAYYDAQDLIKFIPKMIGSFPDRETQWAEIIITYLEKTKRDRYNTWKSERKNLVEKIYSFQTSTIQSILPRLGQLFKQRIASDHYEALQFCDILIAFGIYQFCKKALEQSLSEIPKVKENEWIRRAIAKRISFLSIETQVKNNELKGAIESIQEANEIVK